MKVTAKLNYLRIAPRKVRLVADIVRRKNVEQAQAILSFTIKRASKPILKLLNSALANAKNVYQIEPNNLYISKITVDEGPKLKRWRARSRGRAFGIEKKTSHITLELEEIKPGEEIKKKKTKVKSEPVGLKGKKEVPISEERESIDETEKLEIKKPKTRTDTIVPKPENRGGIKRMFRRKSF